VTFRQIFDREAPMSWWSLVLGWMIGLYLLVRMPDGTSAAAGIFVPIGSIIVVEHIVRTGRYFGHLFGVR